VTGFSDTGLENAKTYFYKIMAMDASGNEGPESLPVIGLPQDLVPPAMPQVGPLPELTNQREHQVSGTAEPNASVVVVVDKAEAITLPVGPDGRFSGTLTLENGVRRVQFKTIDPALNPSALTEESIVHVDLNPPYIVSSTPVPDQKGVRVGEWIVVSVSEGLFEGTLRVELLYSRSGIEVGSSFEYAAVAKTITIYPTTQLEKGTEYRVVVNGTDAAGNYLVDGTFDFTTVEEKVKDPTISTGGLVGILLLIVIIAIAAFLALRFLRRPEEEGPPDGTPPTPEAEGPVEAEFYHEEQRPYGGVYDPRPEDADETATPEGWEEY
jgi:hypothetical protein